MKKTSDLDDFHVTLLWFDSILCISKRKNNFKIKYNYYADVTLKLLF